MLASIDPIPFLCPVPGPVSVQYENTICDIFKPSNHLVCTGNLLVKFTLLDENYE